MMQTMRLLALIGLTQLASGQDFDYCKYRPSARAALKAFWATLPYKATPMDTAFHPTGTPAGGFRALRIGETCNATAVTLNKGVDPGCLVNGKDPSHCSTEPTCETHYITAIQFGAKKWFATCVAKNGGQTCQFKNNPNGIIEHYKGVTGFRGMRRAINHVLIPCGIRSLPLFSAIAMNTCAPKACLYPRFWRRCKMVPSSDSLMIEFWKKLNFSLSLDTAFRTSATGGFQRLRIGEACSATSIKSYRGMDPGCMANGNYFAILCHVITMGELN
jgi:hypothetical protein